jgi:SPX domain protein involved in polyphosphate accumulation
MFLVDVYVPSVDQTYDFMLDENTEIDNIIKEICEMLSKKIQNKDAKNSSEFTLYHMNTGKALDKAKTLGTSAVKDGSRLMLV